MPGKHTRYTSEHLISHWTKKNTPPKIKQPNKHKTPSPSNKFTVSPKTVYSRRIELPTVPESAGTKSKLLWYTPQKN